MCARHIAVENEVTPLSLNNLREIALHVWMYNLAYHIIFPEQSLMLGFSSPIKQIRP